MKRVAVAVALMGMFSSVTVGQISSLNGELRYQYQFQDTRSEFTYARFLRQSPELALGTSGFIVTPALLSFNLRTSLLLDNTKAFVGPESYTTRHRLFNFYNLSLSGLDYTGVRVALFARENEIRASTDIPGLTETISKQRQRQHRITLSTDRFDFLPSTTVSYARTRNWSVVPSILQDQQQEEYAISLSRASASASLNLSGSLTEIQEMVSGFRTRNLRVQLNGTTRVAEQDRMDANAELYQYNDVTSTTGTLQYTAHGDDELKLNTSVTGRNMVARELSSRSVNLLQGVQYLIDRNFQVSVTGTGNTGSDVNKVDSILTVVPVRGWSGSAGLQHSRSLPWFTFSNGFNTGYGQQRAYYDQATVSFGINNTIQAELEAFQLSASQSLSSIRVTGTFARRELNQNYSFSLSGPLPYNVVSDTRAEYSDDRRTDEFVTDHQLKTLRLQQQFRTSLYYHIPLSLGIGGSLTQTWSFRRSRFHGLFLQVNSSRFFVAQLSFSYSLTRSYDPTYLQAHLTHHVALQYQLRSLALQLNWQRLRFIDTRNEIRLVVSRPFDVGF